MVWWGDTRSRGTGGGRNGGQWQDERTFHLSFWLWVGQGAWAWSICEAPPNQAQRDPYSKEHLLDKAMSPTLDGRWRWGLAGAVGPKQASWRSMLVLAPATSFQGHQAAAGNVIIGAHVGGGVGLPPPRCFQAWNDPKQVGMVPLKADPRSSVQGSHHYAQPPPL